MARKNISAVWNYCGWNHRTKQVTGQWTKHRYSTQTLNTRKCKLNIFVARLILILAYVPALLCLESRDFLTALGLWTAFSGHSGVPVCYPSLSWHCSPCYFVLGVPFKVSSGVFHTCQIPGAVFHNFYLSTCSNRPIHVFSLTNTHPQDRSPNCWNTFSVQKKPVIQMGLLSYDSLILWNSALTGYHKDVFMSVHTRTFFTIFFIMKGEWSNLKPLLVQNNTDEGVFTDYSFSKIHFQTTLK